MTQDEIIEMARQAGFEDFDNWSRHYPNETKKWCERMEAFAKLVAAKEREACAKLCDDGVDTEHLTVKGCIMKNFGSSFVLAAAIRARGEA